MDNHNRICTSDNRLLRRIIRDNRTRGYNVDVTLNMDKIKTNLSSLKISDSNPYNNMDSVNDLDLIEGYGIDVSLLDEYVIYISSSVEDPSMYMVLNIKEGNESVVKYQINDMFDKYLSAYKGYYRI